MTRDEWLAARAAELRAKPTQGERAARSLLRTASPVAVQEQVPLHGYIADFYLPDAKLVIEIDGSSHAGRREQDNRRDAALRAQGIETLRLGNRLVRKDRRHCRAWLATIIRRRLADIAAAKRSRPNK